MKIKDGYLLRQVAGNWVVVPLGEATLNFNGMMTLNESGKLLWRALENGTDRESLAAVLTERYEVSWEQALTDVGEFVQRLTEVGCVE